MPNLKATLTRNLDQGGASIKLLSSALDMLHGWTWPRFLLIVGVRAGVSEVGLRQTAIRCRGGPNLHGSFFFDVVSVYPYRRSATPLRGTVHTGVEDRLLPDGRKELLHGEYVTDGLAG